MSDTTDTTEDMTGLKNKVKELLGAIKTANERAERAEREKEEAADAASSANSTELEKMQKRAEKAERDLKAANDRAESTTKSLRDYKADNAIAHAIASANVDAKHVALLAKALRADVEFTDEGEPTIGGKAVDAYAKSFFAKDGLSYVRAANNTGGLATGNDGTTASQLSKAPETADEYNTFFNLTLTDKVAANALADQWGRADLKS
ncbi:hypothetical protein [Sphingomonas sp. Leaf242]|uniref:hypothetical protein n=1 Tax=Sphingomonas sp. Leaf242 TaxID=1736304 RepID=UPI0007156A9B|nr:hypothetical protein [Sphingomonas sp. Leaf242]KQO09432.1 hypothetical protein ASF09_07350 [Sphingomonas sp. Leaf242]